MKKILLIVLALLLLLSGCTAHENVQYGRKEQPHLYWRDIDVVVTSVDKRHWFTPYIHHYEVKVSAKNEEYQLSYTCEFRGSGFYGCPKQWKWEKVDVVKAELYSWVMYSTGEVVRREIHKVY